MPNEILEQIFSYVAQDPTSALRAASRVCHHFRAIIQTNSYFRTKVSHKVLSQQLYHAESIHPSLFPKNFLPCYGCNHVLDSRRVEFNFYFERCSNGKGSGGVRAKSRRCLRCDPDIPHECLQELYSILTLSKMGKWIGYIYQSSEDANKQFASLSDTGHEDWQGRLRQEHLVNAKGRDSAHQSSRVCSYLLLSQKLASDEIPSFPWLVSFIQKFGKKFRRLDRRKYPTPIPVVDEILADVSCVHSYLPRLLANNSSIFILLYPQNK